MPLPSVARTWQFRANIAVPALGSQLAQNRRMMWEIKQSLVGAGAGWTNRAGQSITPTGNWTVVGSSNGVVAAMDGVDRWATENDIAWASSGPRRWIVLQQAGILPKFQILIVLLGTSASSHIIEMYLSHTGFGAANGGTDGSVSVNPTASVQTTLLNSAQWGAPQSDLGTAIHVMRSASGDATRIFILRNSRTVGEFYFELLNSYQAGWTTPYYALVSGTATTTPITEWLTINDFMSANALGRGYGSSALVLRATCEGSEAGPLFNILTSPNYYSNAYPLFGVGVYASAINVGRHALMSDLWFGLTSISSGHCYPLTPAESREFCQFGFRVVPWNGSVPIVGA